MRRNENLKKSGQEAVKASAENVRLSDEQLATVAAGGKDFWWLR
jgi:hypothetical protein